MNKQDLTLNNLQELICRTTQPTDHFLIPVVLAKANDLDFFRILFTIFFYRFMNL